MTRAVPIYIVSKGRADSRLTNRALAAMGIDHFIVVEAQEADAYRAVVERATVLVLDPKYQDEYETCDDLGRSKSVGPGPARNFAWDHAVASGAAWHWVMDDNIAGFFRLNYNLKTPAPTPAVFDAMETFADRYENLAMAGPNYFMFASRKSVMPPYVTNTRIYSCNLIRNAIPFRWRGRYNEDTDLSLRILKAGLATVQFNAFLQYKMPTQVLGGGNTAEFYANEGTRPKSEMLARLHPDVATVVEKFGRIHHQVDYGPFKRTRLRRRFDLPPLPDGPNNFGMVLQQKIGERWVRIDRPTSEPKRSRYATGEEEPKATLEAEELVTVELDREGHLVLREPTPEEEAEAKAERTERLNAMTDDALRLLTRSDGTPVVDASDLTWSPASAPPTELADGTPIEVDPTLEAVWAPPPPDDVDEFAADLFEDYPDA